MHDMPEERRATNHAPGHRGERAFKYNRKYIYIIMYARSYYPYIFHSLEMEMRENSLFTFSLFHLFTFSPFHLFYLFTFLPLISLLLD